MDNQDMKEVELAKRGVDAFVDRANELHHQGRHFDALKQLERARRLCEKKLGPMHKSTVKVLFILSSMREADGSMRRPSDCNLHFVFFDMTEESLYQSHNDLARILRRRVFIEEMSVPDDIEFDSADREARHSLGLYGDAPVAYARWRLVGSRVVIDRLCTLRPYRKRGVARTFLNNIFRDVTLLTSRVQIQFDALVLHVPKDPGQLHQRLLQENFMQLPGYAGSHVLSTQMCLPVCYLPVALKSSA
mmetsp:Transcript_9393/g.28726  ORF Transcript_9393/g.28726 Transcript_9393/m.28726 type:complete len:247 (+) Transcript_9393:120-860(+)|eukprot:CAMPEP_0198644202 /NCGR_PEP_ID=MMETSP1467-20131203/466_1 /TAXON_ID=1462469 /ORGANISM="unid. sp., Strain CCMP2135" /LENGTH=246 /DNA_ID=CAMNT_0044379649 /DNA_START=113 /DNA_END=853 /DNA_ORIENTATION=+